MPEDTEFVILTKNNYDRQQKDNQLELLDYKSRNEKAIEYIRNNIADIEFIKKRYRVIIDDYVETTINDIEKLLNILNGGDKDE